MLVLDFPSVLAVMGLMVIRLGVPMLGIWLVGRIIRRVASSRFWPVR